MDVKSVKKKIKKKFGTLYVFAMAAKMTNYQLEKLLRFGTVAEIDRMVASLRVPVNSGVISPKKLEKLRERVIALGGVKEFCEKNPKFSDRTLYQVLQGRRTRMSDVVKELFDHFEL